MGILNELFCSYGPAILSISATRCPPKCRVIDALCQCRTEAQGAIVYHCTQCGHPHTQFRSCGNRHCPGCQHHKAQQWLEKQIERQLPGPHLAPRL